MKNPQHSKLVADRGGEFASSSQPRQFPSLSMWSSRLGVYETNVVGQNEFKCAEIQCQIKKAHTYKLVVTEAMLDPRSSNLFETKGHAYQNRQFF